MVSDARKKKAAQKKADNGVDNVSDGDSALQISDRTCTGDLCFHPVSRDIRIESLPVAFHGHDLIVDSIKIAPPPAIPNQASNRTDLARIADSLEDEYHIGFTRHRPRCHRRYTVLRSNELFNRLCVLYFNHFRATYRSFKSTIEAFDVPAEAPQGTTQLQLNKLSHTTLLRYYSVERDYSQDRHDPFVHHLLSVIKPTHLFGSLEDVLFIPLICNNVNFNNAANPFSIARFIMNDALVQGLLDCMDAKNSKWRTVPLPHETLGRPFWLLDWRLNQAYAWFPQEGHFSKEDLIAAQILGIPCTPRLGPCKVDDWQFFAGNALPAQLNVANYKRATPRRFYGAAERYGLLGLNGCGESTLLAAIELRELPVPEHMDIYHLTREIEASDMSALEADDGGGEQLERIYERLDAMDASTAEKLAAEILFGLGFNKMMQEKKTRLGNVCPPVFETIDSLAEALNEGDIGGLVLVSHDFRLINQVAEEIWVCENQTVTRWEGNIMDSKAQATSQE
ncbi:hypothetical protein Gotur_035787 [Gossypium turneri]